LVSFITLMFDGLLVKQKIVCNRNFSAIHTWMEEYSAHCHYQCRNVKIDINEIKELILAKTNEIDEEVLTDYLRVALGHLLLVSLLDGFAFNSDYTLMKTAFQSYLDRGFNNCNINASVIVDLRF
jgi:hypothetical protein